MFQLFGATRLLVEEGSLNSRIKLDPLIDVSFDLLRLPFAVARADIADERDFGLLRLLHDLRVIWIDPPPRSARRIHDRHHPRFLRRGEEPLPLLCSLVSRIEIGGN